MTVTVPRDRDGEVSKMVLSSSSSQCNEGDGHVKWKSLRMYTPPNGEEQRTEWSVVPEERKGGGGQQRLHQGENAPVELEDECSKQIKS